MIEKIKNSKFLETNKIVYLGSLIICIISFIFLIISFKNIKSMERVTDKIYTHPYEVFNAGWLINSNMSHINVYVEELVNEDNTLAIEEIENYIEKEFEEMKDYHITIYEKYLSKSDEKEVFFNEMHEIKRLEREIAKLLKEGNIERAREIYENDFSQLMNSNDETLKTMIYQTLEHMSILIEEGRSKSEFIYLLLLLLSSGIIIISILFAIAVSKKRKEDLRSRELLFDMLTENIDDVFFMYNIKKSKMEFVSRNIERIFGVSHKVALSGYDAMLPYMQGIEINKILEEYKTNPQKLSELRVQAMNPKTLEKKWIQIRIYPVVEGEELVRYIVVFTNITEMLETQRNLKNALALAEEANNSKRDFLSRMSHEIRTPINAIVGMTTIANESLDNKLKIKDCLSKIKTSSTYLLGLISDILDMSKIETGKMNIVIEKFDLENLIANIVSIIQPQAKLKGVDFKVSLENINNKKIIGDELKVKQVLINILANALKFTPVEGEINLTIKEIEKDGELILIFTITDTGIGMSEEELKRIFSPFEQANIDTHRKYGGTGLGLSITKKLVELMEGDIHVRSKKGIGSEFIIELPLVVEGSNENKDIISAVKEDTEIAEELTQEQIDYDFSDKRILLVEDNELNLEIASELLKFKDTKIEVALNGKEDIEKFEESLNGYYDAILMDIQMPILGGYEATEAIRKSSHKDAKTIPIIAMTANAFSEDIDQALESGMNAHISKPIDQEVLYSTLYKFMKGEFSGIEKSE